MRPPAEPPSPHGNCSPAPVILASTDRDSRLVQTMSRVYIPFPDLELLFLWIFLR